MDTLRSLSANVFLSHERAKDAWDAINSTDARLSVDDRLTAQNTIERLQRILDLDWQRKGRIAA